MSEREQAITPASFASFGALLRYLRQRALLSRAELARAAGYSESQIARLELDQRRPDVIAVQARFVPALGLDAEPAWVERLIALAKPTASSHPSGAPAANREMAAETSMAGALASDLPTPPKTPELAEAAWPSGTTTFLFTDIEGSSRLWEHEPQAMPAALQRHEALLRQAIAEHRGVVFKTIGDAVCAAFASAPQALAAALASQRALLAEAWDAHGLPAGQPVRVRMALHSGAAQARDSDYVGPPLNRVARLLAAAHGGQVLLSHASAELVADGLPVGVSLRDLGTHELKGLGRPEQIFQLVGPDLPSDFPPLRSVAPTSANVPAPASPLLATKLYLPPARSNLVPRPRLIERLQAGLKGKLTVLAAPAGFGKTTLLSEWLAPKDEGGRMKAGVGEPSAHPSSFIPRPFKVAWVSLDAGDNDPTRFWSYVCAALDAVLPGVAETALALLQSPRPPPAETLLPGLLNAVSAHDTTCVLVLDDCHVIEAPAIHAALTFLLEHVPPRLHLVIASRVDPPLPLARLRARSELSELRAAELRFTPAEAAAFLTDIMGLPLSPEEVAALETRTEGWIAGLQLAALAMRDRGDRAGFISAFTGSNRYVGEYLADEVFARQPSHIQSFLLRTSILSRMCGPLCDAVMLGDAGGAVAHALHPAAPGASFSQVLLEELERANLFVVPLDDARQWYRYHHLFGEMLHGRLLSGASGAAVATLHRHASAWYEAQGLIAEAVQHALAAHDWKAAARLLKNHGTWLLMQSGQAQTVLGWLHDLPAAVVQQSPTLCLVHGLALVFTNQFAAAEVRLADAERALQPDTSTDRARRVRGNVAVMRGGISYFTGDVAQTVSFMKQGLALLAELPTSVAGEEGSDRARAVAAVGMARTYKLTGDVSEASERQAAGAVAPARATGYVTETLHSYSTLASLQVLQGRLRAAAATYAEIARLVPGPDALHSVISGPAFYFGMGELRREWNKIEEAENDLARGIALVQGGLTTEADVIVLGYCALARVQQARGHGEAALLTLDAFVQLARERQLFQMLIEQVGALRARLQLLQGDLPAAMRWLDKSGLSPDDEPYFPREAAELTLARVHIAAGQVATVLPLLDRLLADAESKARMHSAIEILIVQALAYDVLSDRARALTTLERALALAEPEGYVRMFVDEGAAMAALLRAAASRSSASAYVERLLAAFGEDEVPSARLHPSSFIAQPLVEPLSERELEVLRLVADGCSNRAIAQALTIGVGTVKRHMHSLLGKLAAPSRSAAVARARALGLL
jgi:LuxR family maltose regulon positive regulatory protein